MRRFGFALGALFVVTCLLAGSGAENALTPFVVLSGANSAISTEQCIRVTSQDEWESLWSRHAAETAKSKNLVPVELPPVIDFERCMIIALFEGERTNVRGLIFVESIDADDEIVIRVDTSNYQSGPEGDRVTPFGFLVFPRSSKALVIQFARRNSLQDRTITWMERHRLEALDPAV